MDARAVQPLLQQPSLPASFCCAVRQQLLSLVLVVLGGDGTVVLLQPSLQLAASACCRINGRLSRRLGRPQPSCNCAAGQQRREQEYQRSHAAARCLRPAPQLCL